VRERLETDRLILHRLAGDDLDAWLAGDRIRLEGRTGGRFPATLEPPPLFQENLPAVRDLLHAHAEEPAWSSWLMLARANGAAVGIAGFAEVGDAVVTGYSIYPPLQRQGLATEAMRALVEWLLGQRGETRLRATIPPDNTASVRVAEKLGMELVGNGEDQDARPVLIYELPPAASPEPRSQPAQDSGSG
jgi:RimJ/RimL family protein N-acetyltransferase